MSSFPETPTAARTAAEIRDWLTAAVARELELEPGSIDPEQALTRYGLDSLAAVVITTELEEWLGRSLPADLMAKRPTIDFIARSLAGEATPAAAVERVTTAAPAADAWTKRQRAIRRLIRGLMGMLMRVETCEIAALPASGPYVLAANHLHLFDAPIVFALLPARFAMFAARKFRRVPVVNLFLRHAGEVIYVDRGESDREALRRALDVLNRGGRVALAPEGKISRPGLSRGQLGAVYLAAHASVPVVPVALWGHERPFHYWLRLRRDPVNMRVGSPLTFRREPGGVKQLEACTQELMVALASLLPPAYAGVYAAERADA